MDFKVAFKYSVLAAVFLTFALNIATAAEPSKDDLKKMEEKVLQQSMEHKKLQAQATQINLELTKVSREMVKAAKKIQNNEDKLSKMETQLDVLGKDLEKAKDGFAKEDENLIKTLAALQNLALKPTEALLVQPLNPVDIIRSAMILRGTVPYLEENADRIRNQLQSIATKKSKIEKQIEEISKQKIVLQAEHDRMQTLVRKKSQLRNNVERKSEQAKKNMDKLASQAQNLRDLLKQIEKQRLEKEAEQRQREEKQRKLEEKQSDDLIKSEQAAITNIAHGFEKAKAFVLKVKKLVPDFMKQIGKRLGKKGGPKLIAKILGKLTAKLVPGVGTALLLADLAMATKFMVADKLPFGSAVCKAMLGFDPWNHDEPILNEDGTPVTNDTIELANAEAEGKAPDPKNMENVDPTKADSIALADTDVKPSSSTNTAPTDSIRPPSTTELLVKNNQTLNSNHQALIDAMTVSNKNLSNYHSQSLTLQQEQLAESKRTNELLAALLQKMTAGVTEQQAQEVKDTIKEVTYPTPMVDLRRGRTFQDTKKLNSILSSS